MSDQNFCRSTFQPFTYRLKRPTRPPPCGKDEAKCPVAATTSPPRNDETSPVSTGTNERVAIAIQVWSNWIRIEIRVRPSDRRGFSCEEWSSHQTLGYDCASDQNFESSVKYRKIPYVHISESINPAGSCWGDRSLTSETRGRALCGSFGWPRYARPKSIAA